MLTASAASGCAEPDVIDSAEMSIARDDMTEALEERARISASPQLEPPARDIDITASDGPSLVASLDIPAGEMRPTFLSLVSPDPEAALTRTNMGVIRPRRGADFLLLSTGRSGNDGIRAERGWDFPPLDSPAGDVVTLRFRIIVPPGLNRLSFDFLFLSAESPEYVGTQFNDTFTARVSDAFGQNRVIATATVNEANFHDVSATNIGPGPFLLYADNAADVDEIPDTGIDIDAGMTDFRTVNAEVASGIVTIEFDIRDVGDGILDSAVIIDNAALSAIEVVDTRLDLIDEFGEVLRAPDPRLVSGGQHVGSIAADGATQVLLRGNVPGPGTATFTVTSGVAADGTLSRNDAALAWGARAEADAVSIGGQWYVFALYRSPPDFSLRPEDGAARERAAPVTMQFQPIIGQGFQQSVGLKITRPPVVIVPDLWSDCLAWLEHGAFMDPAPQASPTLGVPHPFTVSCAAYGDTGAKGFAANRKVLSLAIDSALTKMRQLGVAVSRVDVVGHGLGGLLARRYIDEPSFVRFDNFNGGSINRLITMNTPHLGSRVADEIVRFREFTRGRDADVWAALKATNEEAGIRIDALAGDLTIDEMMTTSAMINGIGGPTEMPRSTYYHALVSGGGRAVPEAPARGLLGTSMRVLYSQMESNHPKTFLLTPAEKRRLILGGQSYIFCNNAQATAADQHDLFATVWEQQGGLADAFTSQFPVALASPMSGHFLVQNDRSHTERLVALLNAPVAGGLFATSMPSPAAVPRMNGCPMVIPWTTEGVQPHLLAAETLAITAPAAGTTVVPGSAIPVAVAASGEPEMVILVSSGQSLVFDQPPFAGTFVVPRQAAGTLTLRALAFYAEGGIAVAPPIRLNVNIAAQLVAIEVLNGDAALPRPGAVQQVTVVGTYSDGVRRDLTSAARGTIYRISSLRDAASVSANGLVTALVPGDATLAVANGSRITSINVKVGEPACGDEVLDAGEECDDGNARSGDGCSSQCRRENRRPVAVCESPAICTDSHQCSAGATRLGAGSSDPDGSPLSITQSPPGPYAVGQHTVAVAVTDGELADQCTSQLEVVDCEPPSLECPADFTAECTADGKASIDPPAAQAADNCAATVQAPPAGERPLGPSELTYTASDAAGNAATCTTTVTVRDTIAPTVTAGRESSLWPANHRYRTVRLEDCDLAVEDACGGRLGPSEYRAAITCVTADESDDARGHGDGDTQNDIVLVDDTTVRLRAERDDDGDGRIYHIHVRVQDRAGNPAEGVCTVVVPIDADCTEHGDNGPANSVCAP